MCGPPTQELQQVQLKPNEAFEIRHVNVRTLNYGMHYGVQ